MVQNAAILPKIQVQYKFGQGKLYYGLDIFPKSTTMAVSAHAQWQIRQKKPKRKHGAFVASSHSKENSHVQLSTTHVTLTVTPTTM